MNEDHPDADKLLTSISKEEDTKKRGKLNIFFGMYPGVGKTFAMLEAARLDLSKGVDVVIGYIDSHDRPETEALSKGFDMIPRKIVGNKEANSGEMDLEAIILRHPYLVLIDDLAHTNAAGSRHAKRYQDVEELLSNGINVYTTLNIQHLESRSDIVSKITGITVQETVPDEIFEMADDVQLIDITPTALLDRFAEGKIYTTPFQNEEKIQKVFRKGNITALREMSLRLVADRVDKQLKSYMQQKKIEGPWKSGMNLLVLVGPSKSSTKLIRWAKNLSYTMGAHLVALHVENTQVLDEEQQAQLTKNIDLARQFGAEVIITSGDDLVSTTLNVARRENITHIIIGKSGKQSFLSSLFSGNNFVNRLLKESGEIDIYVIEPGFDAKQYKKKLISDPEFSSPFKDYILATLAILLTVLVCLPLSNEIGYQPISFILLFVVLVLSRFFRLGPIMLASALSAVSWNFFFIPPQFTVKISKPEDLLAFLMFFFVAFITGSLTSKVRKQVILTKKREERTSALFHLANHLANADNSKDIIEVSRADIKKYFGIETYFFLQDGEGKLKKKQSSDKLKNLTESEYEIAQWVFKHSKKAGKNTDTVSDSEYTFYPLKGTRTKPGVIITKPNDSFDGETELFWDTFLTQIANTLEHHQFAQLAKKSVLSEESDKLHKAFFNSISSELKKPVVAITEASDNLLDTEVSGSDNNRLCNDIHTASSRLSRVVDNLSTVSRLESGQLFPRFDWCNVKTLFNNVTENLKDDLKPYHLDVIIPETMPLVKVDYNLMRQALDNLVYNSCKYSKTETTIRLRSFYDNGYLIIQEMDRGTGFVPEDLPVIFTKFYKSERQASGGFGIGLFVVKSIVEAHNGSISVENRQYGGVRFTIKIPTEVSYDNIQQ